MRSADYNIGYIAVNIPILIFGVPFWNSAIDSGAVAEPQLRTSGFHVGLYPSADTERSPQPIMSIVWSATKLDDLTKCLGEFINHFIDEAELKIKQRS